VLLLFFWGEGEGADPFCGKLPLVCQSSLFSFLQ